MGYVSGEVLCYTAKPIRECLLGRNDFLSAMHYFFKLLRIILFLALFQNHVDTRSNNISKRCKSQQLLRRANGKHNFFQC